MTVRKKKQLRSFKFCTFIGRFSTDIMAMKGLIGQHIHLCCFALRFVLCCRFKTSVVFNLSCVYPFVRLDPVSER